MLTFQKACTDIRMVIQVDGSSEAKQ